MITNLEILNIVFQTSVRYDGSPWFDMKWIKVSMLLRNVMESMGKVDVKVNTGHPGTIPWSVWSEND